MTDISANIAAIKQINRIDMAKIDRACQLALLNQLLGPRQMNTDDKKLVSILERQLAEGPGIYKLEMLLKQTRNAIGSDSEIGKKLGDYLAQRPMDGNPIDYPATTGAGFETLKSRYQMNQRLLPDWQSFYSAIFEPLETQAQKHKHLRKTLPDILDLFGYHYLPDFVNYQAGAKMFDPNFYDEFRSRKSKHPHNSIVEVVLNGILDENDKTFRRPLVISSFNM